MANMYPSPAIIEEIRKQFGGSQKIPSDCVAALRDNSNKKTFAMTEAGVWSLDQMKGLSDHVEKLWVAEGWQLELWEHPGMTGGKDTYHCAEKGRLDRYHHDLLGGTYIWGRPDMEDASCVRLTYLGYSKEQVAIFWQGGMGSKSYSTTYIPGDYQTIPSKDADRFDWAWIPEAVDVTVFEHAYYGGKEWTLPQGEVDLNGLGARDKISSLRVVLPDWELVSRIPQWDKATETKESPSVSKMLLENYACGDLTQSVTLEDKEGTQHWVDWSTSVGTSITVGVHFAVEVMGVTQGAKVESTSTLAFSYGERDATIRTQGIAAHVDVVCPAHSGTEASMLTNRSTRSLPVIEVWRDPATGRTSSRTYVLKTKRGIDTSSRAIPKDMPGTRISECPLCGAANVRKK